MNEVALRSVHCVSVSDTEISEIALGCLAEEHTGKFLLAEETELALSLSSGDTAGRQHGRGAEEEAAR